MAALTKNLADELGRDGINVNVVHPGVTITEKTPEILAWRAERAGISVAEVERQIVGLYIHRPDRHGRRGGLVVTFLSSPKSVSVNGDAISVGGGAIGPIYY